MPEIDTSNKFLVTTIGNHFLMRLSPARISADDALLLAAWLVAMAEPYASHKFADVLTAVQNT